MQHRDIYSFIKFEIESFKLPIQIDENWTWNAREHIRKSLLYKNSVYTKGSADRPFKNITRPILNLQYWAEGFDVKDVLLYVDDSEKTHKSLIIRKYHDKWALENDLDTFIDELIESYVDYGAVLVKNVNESRPEVVPLQSLAFFDQTDLLSGPFAIKHQYSPSQLREVGAKNKWENIEDVIAQAENSKQTDNYQEVNTPGKYIEVYEVHGVFPSSWISENEDEYGDEYVNQLHICTFYKDEKGMASGTTLFKGKEKELPFKLLLRDKIFNRALGLGGAEEIFEPQKWTNYDSIRIRDLLDAASKIVFKTTDPAFANRNKLHDMENLEMAVLEEGKDIAQIDTSPRNLNLFERAMVDWELNARSIASAQEAITGDEPPSGTPFKSVEFQAMQSQGIHKHRQGKLATFVVEIYRDWILPHLAEEVLKADEFMATMDTDEMQFVADKLADHQANEAIKQSLLQGILLSPEIIDDLKSQVRKKFFEGGSEQFFKILENEFKDEPLGVKVNIVGKQKNLVAEVDKMVNAMKFLFSTYNPQTRSFGIFDDPRMLKPFNEILEKSGLSPILFGGPVSHPPQPPQPISEARSMAAQISNK